MNNQLHAIFKRLVEIYFHDPHKIEDLLSGHDEKEFVTAFMGHLRECEECNEHLLQGVNRTLETTRLHILDSIYEILPENWKGLFEMESTESLDPYGDY